jgi:HEAT repeat protein
VDPYRIITILIVAIVGVFLLLLGLILAMKWRRQVREGYERERRELFEPLIVEYERRVDGTIFEALGGVVDGRDREVLQWILLDHLRDVRGSVQARLVEACEDLGLVDALIDKLRSRRYWERVAAAEKLGRMGSTRSIDPLVVAMEDDSPEVRRRAAQAVGNIGGREAVAKLISFLQEPSRWSALRIADVLAGMKEDSVLELMEEFPGLPPASRPLVVDVLARIRSLRSLELLQRLLSSDDANLRARAAHALGQIGDTSSVSALLGMLQDSAWPARAMAAKALGRIAGLEAVQPLCGALTDPEWWVRANAAEALGAKGETGHQALVDMLSSEDAYARDQAVFVLQDSGVLDDFVNQLRGDHEQVERAEGLIKKFISLGRTDRLREAVGRHPDGEVRQHLALLLGRGVARPEGS